MISRRKIRGVWLYVAGRLPEGVPLAAVVGTRWPTYAGVKTARDITKLLVDRGFGVVTGMAKGIDSAAAQAAVETGGYLVGVGPCIFYKGELWGGFRALLEYPKAAAVAERLECKDVRRELAARNKIIALLAELVVVPETRRPNAGRGWGTLYTVKHALILNKKVYVCRPGGGAPYQSAYKTLIRLGAEDCANLVKRL